MSSSNLMLYFGYYLFSNISYFKNESRHEVYEALSKSDTPNIKVVKDVELFKGLRFNVIRRTLEIDNRRVERDVVVFPESVIILPVLTSDRIILIKQYRAAINDYIYEVPAGVVEKGELPKDAARRELVEEIGYEPGELIPLGYYYPVPGYSTEKMHFFIARKLEYVGMRPEPYEVITPTVVNLSDALDMIKNNQIVDLKTATLILYYANFFWKDSLGED